jgi:hypothetical protein
MLVLLALFPGLQQRHFIINVGAVSHTFNLYSEELWKLISPMGSHHKTSLDITFFPIFGIRFKIEKIMDKA